MGGQGPRTEMPKVFTAEFAILCIILVRSRVVKRMQLPKTTVRA